MKLVEILARELDEWPEKAEYVVQEGDGELYQAWGDTPVYSGSQSWSDGDDGDGAYFNPAIHLALSDDWKSAVVTREMWEAERARIKGESVMQSSKQDGPIQWRDLIREIDAEQKAADEAYKESTDHRAAQRASLVAKLKAEGFVLIQSDEPNGVVESAQDDIAQQDMSDPANWEAGDLVEFIVDKGSRSFHKGGLYRFKYAHDNRITIERDDEDDENGWFASYFKWHSRPTN